MPVEHGMVDISMKPATRRTASAKGIILLNAKSIESIREKTNPKGDVLENARLAAIHAVKQTPMMVFMAHPIQISSTKAYFEVNDDGVECRVTVTTIDRTGVEIEAIAGVQNALLAILDLCKRFEKDERGGYPTTKITEIVIEEKRKEEI